MDKVSSFTDTPLTLSTSRSEHTIDLCISYS